MTQGKRSNKAGPQHRSITGAAAHPVAEATNHGQGFGLVPTSGKLPMVILRSPVRQPNVFRKRIRSVEPGTRPGDWVVVYAPPPGKDDVTENDSLQLLGYGIYNPKSEISLRMLRFGESLPDPQFWEDLLNHAISFRRDMLRLDSVTNAYRVVHAEADGLPGLVIDRYDTILSLEAFSLGMYERGREIAERLAAKLGTQEWVLRTSPQMLAQEGFDRPTIKSAGLPRKVDVFEYGTRFRVQLDEQTHKTGFFCDQRENRRRLADYCQGKSVLDLCCYTGGFAVQAKKLGHASEVIGVDLDAEPLELAKTNANLNQAKVRFVQADVFPFMRDMLRNGKQFDVVVLDPPKLIRSREELEEGAKKHLDLNRLALQLVKPGGLLLTCTCAGLLAGSEFRQIVARAARQATPVDEASPAKFRHGREIQIFAQTGAAPDHPIGGNCLETEYLNAIWARVGE